MSTPTRVRVSDAGFMPQEDAAGEGAGLRAVAGALGRRATQQP
jgi:hypothetical protein